MWNFWSYDWAVPEPGRHTMLVRATDGTGKVQTSLDQDPAPDGATGFHEITVTVASSRLRTTISAEQSFDGLHVWESGTRPRRIAERNTRERRDTRNQGLQVSLASLGVPVARLRGGGLFQHPAGNGLARGSESTPQCYPHVAFGTEWWLGRAVSPHVGCGQL